MVLGFALEFQRILQERDARALGPWLAAAPAGGLRTPAVGLEHDRNVVLVSLCFEWRLGSEKKQRSRSHNRLRDLE